MRYTLFGGTFVDDAAELVRCRCRIESSMWRPPVDDAGTVSDFAPLVLLLHLSRCGMRIRRRLRDGTGRTVVMCVIDVVVCFEI